MFILILLSGISAFIIFIIPHYVLLIPVFNSIFHYALLLFYNIPIYLKVIIFILISYPFSCYIDKNKKYLKGIVLYLVAFTLISVGITFGIIGYNNTIARSCNIDSDCHFDAYGKGSFNDKYILLKDPFFFGGIVFESVPTICENNKCKTFRDTDAIKNATSIEDCERVVKAYEELEYFYEKAKERRVKDIKARCYFLLAKKLNDPSLCDKMPEGYSKESCIKQFEK